MAGNFTIQLRFDQWILDRLERWCHAQQRWTGVSHYTWLKMVAAIEAGLTFFVSISIVPAEDVWMGYYVIALCFALSVFGYDRWERASYQRISHGEGNPLRIHGVFVLFRIVQLYGWTVIVSLAMVGELLLRVDHFLPAVAVACAWYGFVAMIVLLACDPLPPCQGRWRELIRKPSQHTPRTHQVSH